MEIQNQEKVDLDSLTGTETTKHYQYAIKRKGENCYIIQRYNKMENVWADLDGLCYTKDQVGDFVSELCSDCTKDDMIIIKSLV